MAGYHLTEIQKGVLGEVSKIQEELDELKDAHNQQNKILELCELSDLIGAVKYFLNKYHPNTKLSDLEKMADATSRAFETGER